MHNNILFIGGIHGVGKSTVCRKICDELGYKYLSASEVLRWNDLNEDTKNKKVTDIPYTQDRLIAGLRLIVEPGSRYVLDGHLCLFDSDYNVTKVPTQTFTDISPAFILVITGDGSVIKARLEERDGKAYDLASLQRMQELEVGYGIEIAGVLGVQCLIASNTAGTDDAINKLKSLSSAL